MNAVERVGTITAFIDAVLHYVQAWDEGETETELWFRGVNKDSLGLLPGAYWRPRCDELSLFVGFQNSAPLYLLREPVDEWDWYYVMQHYRLPTRLLDWSESPLTALYFALLGAEPGSDACVWILDPSALNRLTLMWREGYIVAPGDEDTKHWLPTSCGRGRPPMTFTARGALKGEDGQPVDRDNRNPIAIFARRSSPRIVAQRGVFTVHGSEEIALDGLPIVGSDARPRLARIVIDGSAAATLQADLRALGITESTLFPEAESVSRDLKRLYKVTP